MLTTGDLLGAGDGVRVDEYVVLVVDDDPDIALVCSLQLEGAGFTVLETATGEQALALALRERPSVVLLDYMLPDIDGVEVMRRLRADPATRDIPVVMLTARTHERDQRAAWRAGIVDYVVKPFDAATLVQAVKAAAGWGQDDAARRSRVEAGRGRVRPSSASRHDSAWLAGVIHGANDAIICKTLEGEITYWNRGAERLYGWHADEAVGRHISMLATPETADEIPEILDRVRRGETVKIFDTVRLHRDGHRLAISLCVSPILDDDGAVVGASAIARDITERKRVEAQFSGLLEAAPDAIVAVDGKGWITLVNRQTEQVFGYRREDLVGHRIDMLLAEGGLESVPRPRTPDPDPDRRPQARPSPVEVRARRRDGTVFPAEVSMSTFEADDQVMTVAAVRDVSDRRRADERFRAVVEAAPDAMTIVAEDGTITLVNAQMVKLFGYPREEMVGRTVEMLVPPRFRSRHVRHRGQFHAQSSVRPMGAGLELAGLRKDGTEFAVEISLSPLSEESGVSLTCATIRDVTERRMVDEAKALAAEREREATARLREIDRIRSDFLSTVSHELRTPLTAIRGFSEWLTGSWDVTTEDRKREMLRRIHHAGGRLDFLIQDLLDFSRLERGQLQVEVAPHSLRVLVDEAVQHAATALEGHVVQCDIGPALVLADHATFLRVLENLLTNAAKFSEPGTVINVTSGATRDHVVLGVRDRGVGIDESEHARIFDRFYRVPSTAQATPGTGIGLAIVKQFIEAQGGSVSVSTPPDGGAEFTLLLRRATS